MEKTSSKKQLTYIIIIWVGIIYCVYMLYLSPTIDNIDEITSTNEDLRSQLSDLEVSIVNKEINSAKIRDNNEIIIDEVDSYRNAHTNQSVINYFNDVDKQYKIDSAVLSFNDTENIDSIDYSFDSDRNTITIDNTSFSIKYNADYSNLRKYIDSLSDSDITIDSFTLAFEPKNARVTGTIQMSALSIEESKDNEKDYNVDGIRIGINNLFGNYKEN